MTLQITVIRFWNDNDLAAITGYNAHTNRPEPQIHRMCFIFLYGQYWFTLFGNGSPWLWVGAILCLLSLLFWSFLTLCDMHGCKKNSLHSKLVPCMLCHFHAGIAFRRWSACASSPPSDEVGLRTLHSSWLGPITKTQLQRLQNQVIEGFIADLRELVQVSSELVQSVLDCAGQKWAEFRQPSRASGQQGDSLI